MRLVDGIVKCVLECPVGEGGKGGACPFLLLVRESLVWDRCLVVGWDE